MQPHPCFPAFSWRPASATPMPSSWTSEKPRPFGGPPFEHSPWQAMAGHDRTGQGRLHQHAGAAGRGTCSQQPAASLPARSIGIPVRSSPREFVCVCKARCASVRVCARGACDGVGKPRKTKATEARSLRALIGVHRLLVSVTAARQPLTIQALHLFLLHYCT